MVESIKNKNLIAVDKMQSKWFESEKLTNALIFMIGLVLVFIGIMFEDLLGEQWSTVIISVGASIVASSVVSYITSAYLVKKKKLKEITEIWGLRSITENRSNMNKEVSKRLNEANKCLDIVAYGLKSFRESAGDTIKLKIQNGLKVRILTVNPDSEILLYRDSIENKIQGSTSHDIVQLTDWVKSITDECGGEMELRYCKFLPTELYFRIDKHLYVGPYEIFKESQRTITMEYTDGTKGFSYYTDYFNTLWVKAEKV